MKNVYVKSAVVLTVICLVVAVLLAVTDSITAPYIAENQANKIKSACFDVMPNATDFEEIKLDESHSLSIPESVTSIFKETTGLGYVFTMNVKGYSQGLIIVCAIGNDGKVVDVSVASSNETSTVGGKVQKRDYLDKYISVSSTNDVGDWLISGATKTTKAFKEAIDDAFFAFNSLVKDGVN